VHGLVGALVRPVEQDLFVARRALQAEAVAPGGGDAAQLGAVEGDRIVLRVALRVALVAEVGPQRQPVSSTVRSTSSQQVR